MKKKRPKRKRLPPNGKLPPIDAEGILSKLVEMRKSIPFLKDTPPSPTGKNATLDGHMLSGPIDAETITAFDYQAVADGIAALASELQTAIEDAQTKAIDTALDAYYKAEELAREPEHADLIPHVQEMREAYQESYGRPIPSREETERERKSRKKS
jgi:hypothetical protein